ncbi:MAG TPA: hypothetical protein VL137_13215, partial [Polyangiaceae bacterium]|nr:hypothetical protein [Polyangiaceae bacterium]
LIVDGSNTTNAPDNSQSVAQPAPPTLDANGRERPRFVLAFPRDPELDLLVAAFEAGNYAQVRRDAPRLAASAANEQVRNAALELRRRIDPDPTVVFLLGLAFALLILIAVWAYW